jgi:hypothetical protein
MRRFTLRSLVAFGAFAGAAHAANHTQALEAAESTATGWSALIADTTGEYNTADGWSVLMANTSGTYNTAVGAAALKANVTGSYNTAVGVAALGANVAKDNTAFGYLALGYNTEGTKNTATGKYALGSNNTGSENTASGYGALFFNAASGNTAVGANALRDNLHGADNTAVGFDAGRDTTGDANIDIGNVGVADESAAIRIGSQGKQTAAYIAGISASPVVGSAVYVSASGQLGVLASSAVYKTAVAPMEPQSSKLRRLQPVAFRLKNDPSGTLQYGLIAEDVAKVYPELVITGANGQPQGVRYDELAPMLLDEIQRQQRTIGALSSRIASQSARFTAMRRQLDEMKDANRTTQAALAKLQARDQRD